MNAAAANPTSEVLADLGGEHAALDELLSGLDDAAWALPTPALPWTVLDTVAHLAFFDDRVALAARHPEQFRANLPEVVADFPAYLQLAVDRGRALGSAGVLTWWRTERAAAIEALAAVPVGSRLPWYGPDMSVASAATARLMETWAHGQDVADALGIDRTPTPRLRHITLLVHRAIPNSFLAHGLPIPADPIRLELTAPDGSGWEYGDRGASAVVRGSALDLCLLATQRRERADVALDATPGLADQWLDVAQAFAGPPGTAEQRAFRRTFLSRSRR